jgi:hypothetical protein
MSSAASHLLQDIKDQPSEEARNSAISQAGARVILEEIKRLWERLDEFPDPDGLRRDMADALLEAKKKQS